MWPEYFQGTSFHLENILMKKLHNFYLAILFTLLLHHISEAQNTFTVFISTPDDERIFDVAEDEAGNFYLAGRKIYFNMNTKAAYFLALNKSGEILLEREFIIEDTVSFFGNVYYQNDSIFLLGAKGPLSTDLTNQLWLLCLDNNFQIVMDKTFVIEGYNIDDIDCIINSSGNFVITASIVQPEEEWPDMLLYEISPAGDSIHRSILAYDLSQQEFDIIEKKEGGYNIFAFGIFPETPPYPGSIVSVDPSLNFLSADSIPYNLQFGHTAKWLTDSTYLITGYKDIINPEFRVDLGIVKMTAEDEFIQANHFGKSGDTITYVGA